MVEILAPVGGENTFFSAINAGADAVYLGLDDFSARKNAENFSLDNIGYYLNYAHVLGVKVYVCVNTIIKDGELEKYFNLIERCFNLGADAFIVQDIFLGKFLKTKIPEICLHLSTQACVNNSLGALYAKECGFSRVVLARETNIEEIKKIAGIIETEVFVQGALCSSLSGHCYMSSFIGGNSGNRGLCRQPCRKTYRYGFQDQYSYALSLSDLCLKDKVDELIRANVTSFKIEGRMRSCEYVENAVKVFKNSVCGKDCSVEFNRMKKAFNRGGYTTGYTFGLDKNILSQRIASNLGVMAGKVISVFPEVVKVDNNFASGSGFKIIRNGVEVGSAVSKTDGCFLNYVGKVEKGDLIFVTKDASQKNSLSHKKVEKIAVHAEFLVGKQPKLSARSVTVCADFILDKAKNLPLSFDELLSNLKKTDKYPFEIESLEFVTDGVFIPKSVLNSLRVKLFDALFNVNRKEPFSVDFNYPKITENKDKALAVIINDCGFRVDDTVTEVVFTPKEYSKRVIDEFLNFYSKVKADKYLYLPPFSTDEEISKISDLVKGFKGFYVENSFGVKLAESLNVALFCGIELNVSNSVSDGYLSGCGYKVCLSKELSFKELANLSGYVFSLGSIKTMTLEYCPNNRNCSECAVGDFSTLYDCENRAFTLRRYRADSCKFELYNNDMLVAKNISDKMIFDFSGYDVDFANKVFACYKRGSLKAVRENFKYTNGNLIKGIN
ncbi:MAG: U32 family peptidase [Christensenellaceae bacterium]